MDGKPGGGEMQHKVNNIINCGGLGGGWVMVKVPMRIDNTRSHTHACALVSDECVIAYACTCSSLCVHARCLVLCF